MIPGIVAGATGGLDHTLLREALGSRGGPLAGDPDSIRWVALQEDAFQPGANFLRKFNLACALVLPLAGSGGEDRFPTYLLLASGEPLAAADPLVQQIVGVWQVYRTVAAPGWNHERGAGAEAAEWPGPAAWRTAPVALAVVGSDEVKTANEAAQELLESSVGSDGRPWRTWLAASVRRLLDSGRPRGILPASHSRQRSLEVALGPPLADGENRLVAVRDATAEVKADSQRAETISTLSHELRTPLTSMKNSVALVLRGDAGKLTGEQERFLALSMRNIDRLDRLIGDLLDSSRGAAGRLSLHREVIDLGALLREALEMLAATARQEGITLDFSGLPASFPAHVDGEKVVQMIHNTVGNAIKYTDEGGFVRVWLQTRSGRATPLARMLAERFFLPLRTFTLVVEDNGMGMSEEVLSNLFRPFRRGREAEAKKAPGSGLGLHITRGLVEAHGGTIELSSSPRQGTTVWILLPRDPESERVMVAARRLDQTLAAAEGSRLAFLDVRRPDRRLVKKELRRASRFVGGFLARLARETGGGANWLQAVGDEPGSPAVVDLAPGLWMGAVRQWSRLGPAWEVETRKRDCPSLLAGTGWRVTVPPAVPERTGSEADTETMAPNAEWD